MQTNVPSSYLEAGPHKSVTKGAGIHLGHLHTRRAQPVLGLQQKFAKGADKGSPSEKTASEGRSPSSRPGQDLAAPWAPCSVPPP